MALSSAMPWCHAVTHDLIETTVNSSRAAPPCFGAQGCIAASSQDPSQCFLPTTVNAPQALTQLTVRRRPHHFRHHHAKHEQAEERRNAEAAAQQNKEAQRKHMRQQEAAAGEWAEEATM